MKTYSQHKSEKSLRMAIDCVAKHRGISTILKADLLEALRELKKTKYVNSD